MKDESKRYTIGIMYGEGVGKDLIEGTRCILKAVSDKYDITFDYQVGPHMNKPAKSKRGVVNPIYTFYKKAIKEGFPIISGSLSGGLVYSVRKRFDLFYKLLPIRSIPGYIIHTGNDDIDILLIRQNNAGEYYGKHGLLKSKNQGRVAYQSIRYSEEDIVKIASVAFEYASKRDQKVSLFLKEDGLPSISFLWQKLFEKKHQDYSGIDLEILNVDRGAGELISNPKDFDVVVTLNHDGDIIFDTMVSFFYGSRGMGCSGNFNNNGFATYQTIHGSATDLVGKNKANPIGQILSSAMMLEYSFHLFKEAESIKKSVGTVLNAGYRTEDIFREGFKLTSTRDMCSYIVESVLST